MTASGALNLFILPTKAHSTHHRCHKRKHNRTVRALAHHGELKRSRGSITVREEEDFKRHERTVRKAGIITHTHTHAANNTPPSVCLRRAKQLHPTASDTTMSHPGCCAHQTGTSGNSWEMNCVSMTIGECECERNRRKSPSNRGWLNQTSREQRTLRRTKPAKNFAAALFSSSWRSMSDQQSSCYSAAGETERKAIWETRC